MAKNYDCIIVGAGPAGSAATFTMAREGMDVLLLERGSQPGALLGIRMVVYEGPVLFLILGMIFAYFLPLTSEKFQQLREVLRLKIENKEYDLASIKDLM